MQENVAPVQSLYLGGRVRKQVLPVFDSPPDAGAPLLKRLRLPQGELAQLLDGDQIIRYLAFIELREGTVRGNHFHRVKQEFVYIIHGRALLWVEDTVSSARDKVTLAPGELVFVPAGVAHRLDVLESGQAIEFSEARFDANDTHRYVVAAGRSPG
jgi:mannose-6-phosphate isomerase-like protein (cupin superfamily)